MKKSIKQFIWSKKAMGSVVMVGALMGTGAIFGLNGYFGGGEKGVPEDTWTRGLVASYDFDEGSGQIAYNAADTGSVNDGTLGSSADSDVNDPTWRGLTPELRGQTPNGPSGSSLQFDGTDDYIDCGNDSSLDITDAITIEAWVKSTTPGYHYIVNKNGKTKGYNIYCYDDSNSFRGGIDDGTNSQRLIYNTNLFDGNWHHLVMTAVPGDIVYLYYDGNRVAEGDASAVGDISNSEIFEIGSSQQGIDDYFNGSIDGVKIYNRALSAEEVRYHYNRGGPVAHWKFDEGAGSTAYNSSNQSSVISDNLNGTLYGEMATSTSATSGWTTGKHNSALAFDGTDDFVDVGNVYNGIKTASFWLKPDNLTKDIMDLGTPTISVSSGTITTTGWTSPTIYINGIISSSITLDNWYFVSITTDTGLNADDVDIGKVSTYFDGIIDDVKVYAYARTPDEIRLDYNAGFAARFGGSVIARSQQATRQSCSLDPASCISHGLVASYDFDEGDGQTLYNAADTGSANDGTLGSSASVDTSDPTWTSGGGSPTSASSGSLTSSAALNFDGADDYINCGNDSSLDITDAITIEAWVKTTADKNQIIVHRGSDYFYLYSTDALNGKIGLSLKDIVGGSLVTINALNDGDWHHIAVTYDKDAGSDNYNIYADGVLENSRTSTGSITTTGYLAIGSIQQGGGWFWDGSIDGVKIYNRALSAEEVRYHYNRGGPVAHWKFDEGSGQYARDAIGDADAQLGSDVTSDGDTNDPVWGK